MAFEWCQEGQKCHIYIKQVGVEPPFQLTNAAINDRSPAWSPDGRFIAFIRELESKKLALILIPSVAARTAVGNMGCFPNGEHPEGAISGLEPGFEMACISSQEAKQKRLRYSDLGGNRRKRRSQRYKLGGGDTAPAFSPDGSYSALAGPGANSDLYLLHLGEGYRPKGNPTELIQTIHESWSGWTPDGARSCSLREA